MKTYHKYFLYWTPRIICILFAAFLSLFALDVFSEGYSFWATLMALGIHLVPTYIVIVFLVIAWRWEWIGGLLFICLALLYIIWTWGQMHWSAYFGISGPLLLAGILFMMNWMYHDQLRKKKNTPQAANPAGQE